MFSSSSPAATSNAALTTSVSDLLLDLGGISPDRLLFGDTLEQHGCATIADLAKAHQQGHLCELVDGLLVEKIVGYRESLIAAVLIEMLGAFVRTRQLGLVSGPDGFIQLFPALVRGPAVAFVSWQRLPGGRLPPESYPAIAPDLVVEIISEGNTRAEMARKRREYFHAGVSLVWMVDLLRRTVAVYASISESTVVHEDESLGGGDVLPGLTIPLADVFAVLDRAAGGS